MNILNMMIAMGWVSLFPLAVFILDTARHAWYLRSKLKTNEIVVPPLKDWELEENFDADAEALRRKLMRDAKARELKRDFYYEARYTLFTAVLLQLGFLVTATVDRTGLVGYVLVVYMVFGWLIFDSAFEDTPEAPLELLRNRWMNVVLGSCLLTAVFVVVSLIGRISSNTSPEEMRAILMTPFW